MGWTHPYMPNSAEKVQRDMLDRLGVDSIEKLYQDLIPKHLRFPGTMNLPEPLKSEVELKQAMDAILKQNTAADEYLSFLGAGCYRHHVPALCDEINSRAEFLTAYVGDTYSDHGKLQAIFEYASLMAELLDMDVVSYPTYDEAQAVSSSLRMAVRITGRNEILLPATIHPYIAYQLKEYCGHAAEIQLLE